MLHLNIISKFGEFGKELIALFLLDLELAVLNIEAEYFPNIVGRQLRNELVLAVLGDERDVETFAAEELQHFADLLLHLLDFGCEALLLRLLKRVDDDVEDPFRLCFDLSVYWVESASKLDLQPLRNVFFHNLEVLRCSKQVIDVFRHKFVLQTLAHVSHLLVGGCAVTVLLEDLLLLDLISGVLLLDLVTSLDMILDIVLSAHFCCWRVFRRIFLSFIEPFELPWPCFIFLEEIEVLLIEILFAVVAALCLSLPASLSLLLLPLLAHQSPCLLRLLLNLLFISDEFIIFRVLLLVIVFLLL